LRCFNKALLAKQGLRLIHNPSSLAGQILKARYFLRESFLGLALEVDLRLHGAVFSQLNILLQWELCGESEMVEMFEFWGIDRSPNRQHIRFSPYIIYSWMMQLLALSLIIILNGGMGHYSVLFFAKRKLRSSQVFV
jgi:hypothetical protein